MAHLVSHPTVAQAEGSTAQDRTHVLHVQEQRH
jgi:hypothetical protein